MLGNKILALVTPEDVVCATLSYNAYYWTLTPLYCTGFALNCVLFHGKVVLPRTSGFYVPVLPNLHDEPFLVKTYMNYELLTSQYLNY